MTTATSNSPTDRDPVPSRPPICSAMTVLPDPLARTALAWAGDRHGIPADIRDLRCTLEHHTGSHHYALVHDVAEKTAAWSRWLHDSTPDTLLVLPDCPASHPAHGGCGEYEGHPGGHTWQIDDPLEPPLHPGR